MESVLLYLLGVVVVIVGLALSIGLHELGHLIPAKRFGVRVGQFMIGFGPTLVSRRVGETEYGLKLLPLGGYISMAGMYPPVAPRPGRSARRFRWFDALVQEARDVSANSIPAGAEDQVFFKLPVLKRIVIMLGGPAMNLVLAVLFFGITICGFGIQQQSTTIGSVSECVVPADSARTECTPEDPAAPAAEAGLRPGDTLVSIDGVPVTSWEQGTELIRASPGEPLDVVVDRDGASVAVTVTPLLQARPALDDPDRLVEVGFIGIGAAVALTPQPITELPAFVGDQLAALAGLMVSIPVRIGDLVAGLFTGAERDPEGLIGIVGIGRLAGEVTSLDAPVVERVATLFGLMGSLNLALFLFNLLPLPPLDGGHVAAALVQALRSGWARLRGAPDPGPIDTAKLVPITVAVSVLLIGLTVLLVFVDIVKPVSIL